MSQLFPKWTNHLPTVATAAVVLGAPTLVFLVWYYFSPWYTDVGYAPEQPIPYSHKLHAGLLGMDCRYCHTSVEEGAHAAVPPTQTCGNCHWHIKKDSEVVKPVYKTWEANLLGKEAEPIKWVKVHMLPDYAYFNHSAHVAAGVGCVSCHGRVDQMEIVRQTQPLSMGWCLECHRNPENHLRPVSEVTNMEYEQTVEEGLRLKEEKNIKAPEHCSACHM